MQRLVKGVHEFQRNIFPEKEELFAQLSKGQNPQTLFITCSDSRVVPSIITKSEPGDLFELQNAGNIIPAFGAGGIGEAATIEYAVAALKVTDIVICGHSQCGAMTGLLEPDKVAELPAVGGWLQHAEATRRIIKENYKHLDDDFGKKLTACVEENVLVQLEHLKTHPAVAVALSKKALKLHGWVYKIETGAVFAYDPDEGQFLPLKEQE
ncbi:MAG TPA: carbonate dehydratase [Planctomycetes bacterium]|mgnify:CR=1 FL=1|nr:carbonate dehydratase [Planctomycetota bacterium]